MTDNRPWHKLTWSKAPGELIINTFQNYLLPLYGLYLLRLLSAAGDNKLV